MDSYKKKIFTQLMWDYSISPEEIDKLIKGEIQYAGHYNIDHLFIKLLESFPWFTIIELFKINQISELLNENTINKLRTQSLRKKYLYVKKRLQEIIQTPG